MIACERAIDETLIRFYTLPVRRYPAPSELGSPGTNQTRIISDSVRVCKAPFVLRQHPWQTPLEAPAFATRYGNTPKLQLSAGGGVALGGRLPLPWL